MRFLVDENISPRIAELLRERGHDVLFIPHSPHRGSADSLLHDLAVTEARIVITRDVGFPVSTRLPGILLVRSGNQTPEQLRQLIGAVVDAPAFANLVGRVTVVAPGRAPRSRPIRHV